MNINTSGEEEKSGNARSRQMSVAGWASSTVDSVTGSKGKKSRDTEAFTTLEDDTTASEYWTARTVVLWLCCGPVVM